MSHHDHCRPRPPDRCPDLPRSPGRDTAPPLRPRSRVVRAGGTATASSCSPLGLRAPASLPETTHVSPPGLTRRCWTAVSGRPWTCWFPPYKAPAASHRRGGCKDSKVQGELPGAVLPWCGSHGQVTLTGSGVPGVALSRPVPIRQQRVPGLAGAAAQPLGT